MSDDDVPFMNYRVVACSRCHQTLALQSNLNILMGLTGWKDLSCPKCGPDEPNMQWVTGGYKGIVLIWDEVTL
jgi:predicted nucleic-acid-binding Zn-ribbon protein